MAGELRELDDTYDTNPSPYQDFYCEDDTPGSADPVCRELLGTDGCPTLADLVEVTDWFGDSTFLNRELYRCDFGGDGDAELVEAYFDQPVGSSLHHWTMLFDPSTGVLGLLGRNAVFATGHPEDKLCCEGTLVDIAG